MCKWCVSLTGLEVSVVILKCKIPFVSLDRYLETHNRLVLRFYSWVAQRSINFLQKVKLSKQGMNWQENKRQLVMTGLIYLIYSINRPGRLFNFGPMRVGAYYFPNIFSK